MLDRYIIKQHEIAGEVVFDVIDTRQGQPAWGCSSHSEATAARRARTLNEAYEAFIEGASVAFATTMAA